MPVPSLLNQVTRLAREAVALVEGSFAPEKEIALRMAPNWLYYLATALVSATWLLLKLAAPLWR